MGTLDLPHQRMETVCSWQQVGTSELPDQPTTECSQSELQERCSSAEADRDGGQDATSVGNGFDRVEEEVGNGEMVETRESLESAKEVSLFVEDSEEEQDKPPIEPIAADLQEMGSSSRGLNEFPEFVPALALLPDGLLRKEAFLSPGFRSVVAMAGWDDESLLMATQEGDAPLTTDEDEEPCFDAAVEGGSPRAAVEGSPQAMLLECRGVRDRKREARTPKQAITPLSAGRRHRRPRRQAIHGCSPEVLPVGDLSLNQEFQRAIGAEDDVANDPAEQQGSSEEVPSVAGSPAQVLIQEVSEAEAREEVSEEQPREENSSSSASSDDRLAIVEASKTEKEGKDEAEKPACLDQLRDELSCAVCLDICLEPSTTSCGHSFCRGCLQSVLQKCGPRCPKCRQQLKGEAWRTCPINIVLWNTIQILFPQESATKMRAARKQQDDEEEHDDAKQPPRSHVNPTSAAWQTATTVRLNSRRRPVGNTFRRAFQPPAIVQPRPAVVLSSDEERENPATAAAQGGATANRRPPISNRQAANQRPPISNRQEQIDAALARRLQQAELMRSSGREGLVELMQRELLEGYHHHHQQQLQAPAAAEQRPTMSAAAANLRAVASRAVRHSYRARIHY